MKKKSTRQKLDKSINTAVKKGRKKGKIREIRQEEKCQLKRKRMQERSLFNQAKSRLADMAPS